MANDARGAHNFVLATIGETTNLSLPCRYPSLSHPNIINQNLLINMASFTKILAVAVVAAVVAPSAEAGSVRGRYVWKKLTPDTSSSLSMGIHMPQ